MRSALPEMLRSLERAKLFATLFLAGLIGATESVGIALLVPIVALATDGFGSALPQPLANWTGQLSLPILLAGFAALVTLRALADLALRRQSYELEVHYVDDLRDRAIEALVSAEWRMLSGMSQARNRALLISSIERCGDALAIALNAFRLAATLGALMVVGLLISPLVLTGALGAIALLALVLAPLRRRAENLGKEHTPQRARLQSRMEETLSSLRLVKSHRREARSRAEIAHAFADLRNLERRYLVMSTRARAAVQVVTAITLAGFAYAVISTQLLALPALIAILALFARFVPQAAALIDAWQHWRHAAPAIGEANALIAETDAARETRITALPPPPGLNEAIRFDGVTLSRRANRADLDQVSFTLPARSTTALIGPSGSGKSTIADLLGGLLAPDAGSITIDGIPLAGVMRQSWREQVAFLHQEAVLFAGSARENLLWAAPNASDVDMLAALKRANADFILALPGGLDEPLGEGGLQLSGGERQRLALARALLGNPRLLILDEATSALDPESERAIADVLGQMQGSLTILIIAHRGALSEIAQRHIRIERGRIVEEAPFLNSEQGMNSAKIQRLKV